MRVIVNILLILSKMTGSSFRTTTKNYVFVAEHPTFKTPLRPHSGSRSRPLIRDSVHSRGLRNSS